MSGAPGIEAAARCYAARDFAGAARCAHQIIADDPRHFDALHLLGVLALNSQRSADAVGWLRRALAQQPEDNQAQCNLGNALLALNLFTAAETAFAAVLQRDAEYHDALVGVGNAQARSGRHLPALENFRRALALRPHTASTLFSLGHALAGLGRYDEAAGTFRIALDYASDMPPDRLADIVASLCRPYIEQGDFAPALAICRNVPPQLFGHPVIEWNESLARLMLGDYRAGWRLYESRFHVPQHDPPRHGAQVLDLARVAGRRVLVFAEQGRGDAIQFARYLPLLAAPGAHVIVEAYPDLLPLLVGIEGVEQVIAPHEAPPQHDLLTPLLSLPLAFGTEIATIPAKIPYLTPPADRVESWTARLGPRTQPRIGLCWFGSQHLPKRSIPPHLLDALLARDGLEFHAIQHDLTPSDADWLARHPSVRVHDGRELRDFADTAALVAAMDLVISIDTAVAHLAGALGKEIWLLLPFSADWRWLRGREDSPWYPSARLFRQRHIGGWEDVMREVAAALAAFAGMADQASSSVNPAFSVT